LTWLEDSAWRAIRRRLGGWRKRRGRIAQGGGNLLDRLGGNLARPALRIDIRGLDAETVCLGPEIRAKICPSGDVARHT
jgi:hypothetical protein